MKRRRIDYPFEIRPLTAQDGGGYLISFPDLPGCVSDGETPEEALRNGADALASWLAVAREHGDPVPEPSSLASGRFVQRLPRSLHAQLITRARSEGVSLNTLVVSMVAQGLGRMGTAQIPGAWGKSSVSRSSKASGFKRVPKTKTRRPALSS